MPVCAFAQGAVLPGQRLFLCPFYALRVLLRTCTIFS